MFSSYITISNHSSCCSSLLLLLSLYINRVHVHVSRNAIIVSLPICKIIIKEIYYAIVVHRNIAETTSNDCILKSILLKLYMHVKLAKLLLGTVSKVILQSYI